MKNKLRYERKLNTINEILHKKYKSLSDIGILTGTSGIALFQFYYARYIQSNLHLEIATETIEHSFEKINKDYNRPSYCEGIAGLCWTIQHLHTNEFLDIEIDEFLVPFDTYLSTQMLYDLDQQHFDFLHGALGYGFYFLSRYSNTSNLDLREKYERYLYSLIVKLENFVIKQGTTFKWESVINTITGAKGIDLGLSHGIASIINFLSRLYRFEVFRKSSEKLLKGSVAFLLSTEGAKKNNLSLFPAAIEKEKAVQYNSRISWCYGDLGIGLSLFKAGKALEDKNLQRKAHAIFKHSAKRLTPLKTLVKDAGICHGSYGNALLYQAISLEIKDELLEQTSMYWMKDGMRKAVHKDGYAGYKQWCNTQKGWVAKLSLLEGIAGIGLSIINSLSNKRHKWDECLLIS